MKTQSELTQACKTLRAIGVSLRFNGEEFRVAIGNEESSAYYTNDLHDAMTTGQAMAKHAETAKIESVKLDATLATLKATLPQWSFSRYGGAIQCLPLHRQAFTSAALAENFNELNAVAVISSTCAHSGYIVTTLR